MSALELIWDRLSKVNEGVSTQRDSQVDVLRNLFNRFKILDNENVQQTFDRLTNISNELQALGATDITDHEVVKKLLRSLDTSFDTLALMIQEQSDYKSLHPVDILERLNTHEFQLAEKRDLCVRDWVSSSLNTQPLQPDVQLRQQLELVYQIIVFTEPTGSISSTLSFPHVCCCVPVHIYLKTLTEDFLNFLSSISSVRPSSLLCYPVFTLSVL